MMHASSSTVILDFNSRLLAETNGFLLSGVMCQRISTRVSLGRRTGAAVQGAALARNFNSRLLPETNEKFTRQSWLYTYFNSRLLPETNITSSAFVG